MARHSYCASIFNDISLSWAKGVVVRTPGEWALGKSQDKWLLLRWHWNVHSTHKNPECFPNPGKFDPSRFEGKGPPPFAFVPFGAGPRMCPGKEYSRLKMLVFNVVTKYKWDKVFPDEKFIWAPVLRPTKGLPIKLFPHNKSN